MTEIILNPLDNWYKKLKSGEKRPQFKDLCKFLEMSEEAMYGWMRGKSKPKMADKIAINFHLNKRIFKDAPMAYKKKCLC